MSNSPLVQSGNPAPRRQTSIRVGSIWAAPAKNLAERRWPRWEVLGFVLHEGEPLMVELQSLDSHSREKKLVAWQFMADERSMLILVA